jgi:DinB superfamily
MSSAFPAGLPIDISDFLRQLDDADWQAGEIAAHLSDHQANWQPNNGGSWSVAQCLDHMACANRTYLEALKLAAPKARPGHTQLRTAGWFSRYFVRKTEPPASIKIKTPTKIKPQSQISKEDSLAQFKQSNDAVRRFVLETSHLDLCGVRFKNPFVRGLSFTVATGLLVIAAHNRRHLYQAEQVVKNPAFPH